MPALPTAIIERSARRVGSVIRRKYRLDALLGVGGTAAIFAATHRNGSRVALKVLHPELSSIAEVQTRFLREGYVANRIPHSGVVRIIDDDDDDELETVFLVVELLEGGTLAERAAALGGRLQLEEARDHTVSVLDVLEAAHVEGVVHRDVKPENVFLTTANELKILDFGIARLLDGTGATRSGQLLGTPAFMAPEQAGGRVREVDARSDVWSAGALLFSLLAGRHVHVARSAPEQMLFAATHDAPSLRSIVPSADPELARVVDRALQRDRDGRWPSAGAMRDALLSSRLPHRGGQLVR